MPLGVPWSSIVSIVMAMVILINLFHVSCLSKLAVLAYPPASDAKISQLSYSLHPRWQNDKDGRLSLSNSSTRRKQPQQPKPVPPPQPSRASPHTRTGETKGALPSLPPIISPHPLPPSTHRMNVVLIVHRTAASDAGKEPLTTPTTGIYHHTLTAYILVCSAIFVVTTIRLRQTWKGVPACPRPSLPPSPLSPPVDVRGREPFSGREGARGCTTLRLLKGGLACWSLLPSGSCFHVPR